MRILLAVLLLLCMSCRPATEWETAQVTRVLTQDGFTNITVLGFDFFAGCDSRDAYRIGFTGTKNGYKIKGAVCAGLFFKGWTIRYD